MNRGFIEQHLHQPQIIGNLIDSASIAVIGTIGDGPTEIHGVYTASVPKEEFDSTVLLASNIDPSIEPAYEGCSQVVDVAYHSPDGSGIVYELTPCLNSAVGQFHLYMQKLGAEPQEPGQAIIPIAPEIYKSYVDWRKSQSLRERRISVVDQLEERKDIPNSLKQRFDRHHEYILQAGSFRKRDPSALKRDSLVKKAVRSEPPEMNQCHKTAIETIKRAGESDRVKYAEGVVLPRGTNSVFQHAWVEVDGIVVEPSFFWESPTPTKESIYYGYTLDPKDARRIMSYYDKPGLCLYLREMEDPPKCISKLPLYN